MADLANQFSHLNLSSPPIYENLSRVGPSPSYPPPPAPASGSGLSAPHPPSSIRSSSPALSHYSGSISIQSVSSLDNGGSGPIYENFGELMNKKACPQVPVKKNVGYYQLANNGKPESSQNGGPYLDQQHPYQLTSAYRQSPSQTPTSLHQQQQQHFLNHHHHQEPQLMYSQNQYQVRSGGNGNSYQPPALGQQQQNHYHYSATNQFKPGHFQAAASNHFQYQQPIKSQQLPKPLLSNSISTPSPYAISNVKPSSSGSSLAASANANTVGSTNSLGKKKPLLPKITMHKTSGPSEAEKKLEELTRRLEEELAQEEEMGAYFGRVLHKRFHH